MKIIVGNKILIEDYTQEALHWCHENLILPNPEYHKKQRMGLWCGNVPKELVLYEKDGDNLILPFGCVNDLRKLFPDIRIQAAILPPERFYYASGINLYQYQEKAVNEALNARNGVIVMPCGAGKTQTALELISRIGVKTLWLTHTQDLLNQSLNRAKSVLGCSVKSYGTITGGKINIGAGITFATVQTMSKIDLTQYRDTWGCVVVDECHKAVGSPTKVMQFYKVLSSLACRYKYGLTATPKRSDGLERSMFALLGGVCCEIPKEAVADTTCPVNVQTIETEYTPNYDVVLAGDGTINYAALVDDMIHNEYRFRMVSDWLNFDREFDPTPTLVLANRVEYLEKLNKNFAGRSICLSTMGNSKAAKAARKEVLRKLNDGELDCVFATYQLAKEGLDVPNLRYVVFATPEKDETTVMQAAGRVGRKAEGKPFGTVIDFVDNFGMYKGWAKKRKNIYKKLFYNILT